MIFRRRLHEQEIVRLVCSAGLVPAIFALAHPSHNSDFIPSFEFSQNSRCAQSILFRTWNRRLRNCFTFLCTTSALPTAQVFDIWPAGIAGFSPQTLLAGILVCRRQCFTARCRLVESEITFSAALRFRFSPLTLSSSSSPVSRRPRDFPGRNAHARPRA